MAILFWAEQSKVSEDFQPHEGFKCLADRLGGLSYEDVVKKKPIITDRGTIVSINEANTRDIIATAIDELIAFTKEQRSG